MFFYTNALPQGNRDRKLPFIFILITIPMRDMLPLVAYIWVQIYLAVIDNSLPDESKEIRVIYILKWVQFYFYNNT